MKLHYCVQCGHKTTRMPTNPRCVKCGMSAYDLTDLIKHCPKCGSEKLDSPRYEPWCRDCGWSRRIFTQIVNTEASAKLTQEKLIETCKMIFSGEPMKVRFTCPICGRIYSSIDPREVTCHCKNILFET